MDLRLLDDRVLVRLEKPERLTASKLLWIPDTARREPYEMYQATILDVGPGLLRKKDGKRNPMEVKRGDRVLVYWSAIEMQDGTSVISEKSIQAVLEPEPTAREVTEKTFDNAVRLLEEMDSPVIWRGPRGGCIPQ